MSSKFRFADKFDFTPPFDFKTFEDQGFDIYKEKVILNQKTVKSGIVWVDNEADYYKTFGLIKDDPNKFRIFVELKRGIEKQKGEYKKLKDSGITFNDFHKIHGVSLGANLVKAIEGDKSNTNVVVSDLFNWLGIRKSKEEKTFVFLEEQIHLFVQKYPSEVFEPELVYEDFLKLLQQCISLGVVGINDIAKYLSEEVFNVLAAQIRTLKLDDNRWNPYSKDKEGNPNYDPLIKDFSQAEKTIESFFEKLTSFDVPKTDNEKVNSIFDLLRINIVQIFNSIKEIILDPLKNLNHYIRKNNALIVGFINGLIDAVASIVEGLGFIIGLFNYDNIKVFIEAIKELAKNFSWSLVVQLIKGEAQKLFAFLNEENTYKKSYQIGNFVPKLIEIIVSIITGVKAVQKAVKTIKEIIKDLKQKIKQLQILIKEFKKKLLLNIDNKLLNELSEIGIGVNVSVRIPPTLGSVLPKIEISKKFEVVYKGVLLKTFKNEKELNGYLKKIKKDADLESEKLNVIFKEFLAERNWKVRRTPKGKKVDLYDENTGQVLYRGNEIGIEKYIVYTKLPDNKKEELIKELYDKLLKNSNRYNRAAAKKKLKEKGYNLDIPETKWGIGIGNGVTPDFSIMGSDMFTVSGKLGNGDYDSVEKYTVSDIENALSIIQKKKGIVKVNVTNDRNADFSNCWKELGIEEDLGKAIEKMDLTWHHLDDLDTDLKSSFQLVISEVHVSTYKHLGSNKQIDLLLELIEKYY